MAVLLALITPYAADATERVWRALRARARTRACEDGIERHGPGWRAWAARATPGEPAPWVELAGDDRGPAVLLLDRAIGDDDPADRTRADWSTRRLFDGTPCASIRIDADGRRVALTRDVLGQRALVWADTGADFVVASGEDIILGHPDVPSDLDLGWFAALLAGIAPDDDGSAYRSIRVLPSGAQRTRCADRCSIERQTLVPDPDVSRWTDGEVTARFRTLLDRAVRRCLRGVSRPAISLSGGLDSALVAEAVLRNWHGKEQPLAVAFGFERWPEIDERRFAKAVAERLGFEFRAYAADDLVPMGEGLDRPVCPDTPFATPYREIKQVGYRIAAGAGCDAVLSGNFGDHLYAHPARWVLDAARCGRFDLLRASWTGGPRRLCRDPGYRILAHPWRLSFPAQPAGLRRLAPPWRLALAQAWRRRLRAHHAWLRPTQALLCFDAIAAFDSCGEDWYAARHGLVFRQPLRDPDLVRFMLSLPAFYATRGGVTKWLAREVLRGRLPEAIVERRKGGDLTPFAEAADRAERSRLLAAAAELRPLVEPLLSAAGLRELDPQQRQSSDLPWLLATLAAWRHAAQRSALPRRG